MKFIQLIISVFVLGYFISFSSCSKDTCIHGSGPIVTQDITISDFNGFDLYGSFNIVLKEASDIRVYAEGQQNIISYISTSVSNGIWRAALQDGCYNDYTLTVYIEHPNISEMEISGSGNIQILDRLDSLENLNVFISGSGNVFSNDSIIINNYLNIDISGSGNIGLQGSALNQNINISGSGNYNAFELYSENCIASIPGSGNIEIYADSTLNVFIAGSGSVYYKGNPDITQNITGSGVIIDAN